MIDSNDVALAQAGDYEGFQRLYREYFSGIYSLCARLSGSRDRAKTLTQEVFVKAWEQLADFPDDTIFEVWLRRLAAEVVLSREGIVADTITAPNATFGAEGESEVPVASASRKLELSEALASIRPSARGIFVLHDVEGYQHEEIAEIFGITVGGSKARLQQARVLLMQAMGR